MAIVTRRYAFVGPSDNQLLREVGPASQNATFPTTAIDIDIDNSAAGSLTALDEFMLINGWVQDSEFSPTKPRVLYVWGNSDIGAAADTRFLSPGHDFTIAVTTDILQIPIARSGKLQSLIVRHNSAPGAGVGTATYTVMVNGVATSITATLAVGTVVQAFDIVNTALIGFGDRVSLRVVKSVAGVGDGLVNVQASLECEDV